MISYADCEIADIPCKICLQPVTKKTGIQCTGSCKKWAHFKCLDYTPGKVSDIKAGFIKVLCPCPDCTTTKPREFITNPPFTCSNRQCPANLPPTPMCPLKACSTSTSCSPDMRPKPPKGRLPIPPLPPCYLPVKPAPSTPPMSCSNEHLPQYHRTVIKRSQDIIPIVGPQSRERRQVPIGLRPRYDATCVVDKRSISTITKSKSVGSSSSSDESETPTPPRPRVKKRNARCQSPVSFPCDPMKDNLQQMYKTINKLTGQMKQLMTKIDTCR